MRERKLIQALPISKIYPIINPSTTKNIVLHLGIHIMEYKNGSILVGKIEVSHVECELNVLLVDGIPLRSGMRGDNRYR